jgi:hypothetical protein
LGRVVRRSGRLKVSKRVRSKKAMAWMTPVAVRVRTWS